MRLRFITALMIWGASCFGAAASGGKSTLIAQIETGGQNEFGDERHAVKVDDCQLTTYRWKNVPDEGWVLWTSFDVPMMLVDLKENELTQEIDYFFLVETDPQSTLIFLNGRDGFEFTHEKPFHRKPKGEFTRSPRGDGTTHYFEKKSEVFIMHQGPDVQEKALLFTNAYVQYVRDFCSYTS